MSTNRRKKPLKGSFPGEPVATPPREITHTTFVSGPCARVIQYCTWRDSRGEVNRDRNKRRREDTRWGPLTPGCGFWVMNGRETSKNLMIESLFPHSHLISPMRTKIWRLSWSIGWEKFKNESKTKSGTNFLFLQNKNPACVNKKIFSSIFSPTIQKK